MFFFHARDLSWRKRVKTPDSLRGWPPFRLVGGQLLRDANSTSICSIIVIRSKKNHSEFPREHSPFVSIQRSRSWESLQDVRRWRTRNDRRRRAAGLGTQRNKGVCACMYTQCCLADGLDRLERDPRWQQQRQINVDGSNALTCSLISADGDYRTPHRNFFHPCVFVPMIRYIHTQIFV